MAKKVKLKRTRLKRLGALLKDEKIQGAIAELAAAVIVGLAAAISDNATVRRKTSKLKRKGIEKLDELTDI